MKTVIAMLLAAMLAGCGGSPTSEPAGPTKAQQYTVQLWDPSGVPVSAMHGNLLYGVHLFQGTVEQHGFLMTLAYPGSVTAEVMYTPPGVREEVRSPQPSEVDCYTENGVYLASWVGTANP